MKPSESVFADVRGLRYHLRCWGDPRSPKLFLLHGWMDVSASFQFLVDALRGDWRVIAPDWRGYGLSQWSGADSYWFPDYLGDLDVLLPRLSPGEPATLVGHSMGGNVACLYSGVRPEARREARESRGLRPARERSVAGAGAATPSGSTISPRRRGFGTTRASRSWRRGCSRAIRASRASARCFWREHWGAATPDGRVALRSDPAHKRVNPVLYRIEEAEACWRRVTAPMLWVEGAESQSLKWLRLDTAAYDARKRCFTTLVERTIPDAGHMLHHDQPERLASAIEEFLLS